MFKIAVLDYRILPETQKQIQALAANQVIFPKDRCPEDERVQRTGDAAIVLVSPWENIDSAYLDACPNLRYIGLCGTSTANVDLKELKKRHIAFSNIVSADKEPVAEFFFMELVRLLRGIGTYQWKTGEEHELVGKHVGIIGLGTVGSAIAHLALAYKTEVSYTSPHRKNDWEEKGLQYKDIDTLLGSNEIIFICSPTNVRVLGTEEFKKIKPDSILIQASAGSPFDEEVFKGWIKQAGNFAIFEMSAGVENYQKYKDLPRVIFSEHVAGVTYEYSQRLGRRIVDNLQKYLRSAGT